MHVYSKSDIPSQVSELIANLMPLLLEGDEATLLVLRNQWSVATIASVEYSGAGFFANFSVPDSAMKTDPLNFCGGHADISASGVEHGAGCALDIEQGTLSYLEIFTYGEDWPEHPQDVVISNAKSVKHNGLVF